MKKLQFILFIICFLLGVKASHGQAIVLEKPNSTSIWPAYSIQKIIWNATNIENIKIEASLDSGRNWIVILNSYPASAGFYEWEVPNKVSDSCYIRVSDIQNPNTSSTNFKNNPFKIPAPTLNLENFETIYFAKQQLPILWNSLGVKKVDIFLSYDNKNSFQKIASNIPANAFSFNHILKDTVASSCFVIITDSGNKNVTDTSKVVFRVANPILGSASKYKGGIFDGHSSKNNLAKQISLTNPNKYDSLIGGQKLSIKWDGNNIDKIDLLYSTDTLKTWKIIDTNISANALSYDWKIPNIPTPYAIIKIRDNSDSSLYDVSDTSFMIRKKTLLLRGSTEKLYKKSVFPIYWNGLGIDKIKIYIGNSLLADSINAMNESYNWIIPNNIPDIFYIKIVDISDSTLKDSVLVNSIANLPIATRFKNKGGSYDGHSYKSNLIGKVNIIYPNGGELLPRATKINLQWSSTEIDYLNLYYSIDSGVNWILVDSNVVANLGTYKWKLPNRNSTKVLVKLVYTSDTSIIDYSDKTFTIIDKELSFDLDKTNWIKNSVNQIGWKSLGVDSLRISYKEKDSTRWISLPNIVATNSEKYNWSMPSIVSNMIEIKITDNYDSLFGIQDTILLKEKINIPQSLYKFKGGKFDGNSFKSNINKIIINKPLANEVLISGKPYTVNWDYLNLNDTVLLQYSTDSGKNWINIEKVSALLKTYEWIIPLSYNSGNVTQSGGLFGNNYSTANYINSDQCMIRVLDIKAGNEVVGISKGIFSIKPDGVLVKSVVKFDTIADIKWTGSILYKKLTATTNSNNTVKYFISSASNATIKNDTLIINGPGLINIGCYDPGGGNFSKSDTVFQKFCVIPITPVISRDVNNYLNSSALIGNKWYNSSILISDTTQSIKPTTNGSYTVNTIQGGCPSGISSPYYYIVTDIIVLNGSQYISVNPNPFVDQIVLRFNLNGYSNLNLDVIEMNTGKRLFRKSNLYSGEKIHLDQLSTGYYLFIISSKDTKHSYKFKLMKL